MKFVVCVKQVGILGDEAEFIDDETAVDPDYLDPALNEWDAYAVEEALRLRDSAGGEVVAVTCGDEDAESALRRCLAMGVDRVVRVQAELDGDALSPARALVDAVRDEQPDLVLCGAQSSDASQAATASALAALLDLPAVAVVRRLELDGTRSATVHRELEGGLIDVVEVDLPAVLSIQTGINEPRYATLRAIRQAEEHDVEVRDAPPLEPPTRIRRMRHPRHAGDATMLEGGANEIAQRIVELVRERVP
jgi:electron transfer flavoprotein beta subunit